ncbi:MAG TPA: M20/M25/M40 family metallo-hydrolase [Pyrinomonadaceae bacterium]|nr:M20/M25/M40 family metallo-hydrolase [Pyrinomonadaceae bacterium]
MLRRNVAVVLLSLFVISRITTFGQQPTASATPAAAQAPTTTPAKDPNDPIERIKDEGLNRSQVMQTLGYLSDVIGPRLTASPGMKKSNEWTRDQLTKWGLQNAHLEAWGPFGRGWTLKRFSAQVIDPLTIPLIAYPKAWSPGTGGPITAPVIYVDAEDDADLQRFKGKLKGAIVLTGKMRDVKAHFEAPGTRLNEKDLLALADAPEPRPGATRRSQNAEFRAASQFACRKLQFFSGEGPSLLIDSSRAGDGGTIFVQSASVPQPVCRDSFAPNAPRQIQSYDKTAPKTTPQLVLAVEHYNRIARMIEAGEKVIMTVDLAVEWQDADPMGYNTIAELPGSDLRDEIVMLGGHMDSWHAGTGATDNAAGVAVAMEAMRILQTLNLKPRRTIRIALWTGEEQGLLGSKAYVAEHFGKLETPVPSAAGPIATASPAPSPRPGVLITKPEYEKFSSYFNLDNGTGKIRGVYLQGNESVRGLFRQWLMPFREMGAATLSIANTSGTDHLSFDAIGLPGFQFIQDEIEYDTRTHHSNQDVFDRIQADDMKQAATIMAAFAYNATMRDEKLPRKPAPAR